MSKKIIKIFFSDYPDPFKDDGRSVSVLTSSTKIPPPVAPKPTKVVQKLITSPSGSASNKFLSTTSSGSVVMGPPPPPPPPTTLSKSVNKAESLSQNLSSSSSPPESPTLGSSTSRHRRNVSDTSAFNK